MIEANDINKIHVESVMEVNRCGIVPLLFNDNTFISRSNYTILDHSLNYKEQPQNVTMLYLDASGLSSYYEFKLRLKTEGVKIFGYDLFGNELEGLLSNNILIFVNGEKIPENDYEIIDDKHIRILSVYNDVEFCQVCIYLSGSFAYEGQVHFDETESKIYSARLLGYSKDNYLFFLNGIPIPFSLISNVGPNVYFNLPIDPNTDIIEAYRLAKNTTALLFYSINGVLEYGPYDEYKVKVPVLYDSIITLGDTVNLLVDDLRPGFLIKEEDGVGEGVLEVVDNDYETTSLKCLTIKKFNKDKYFKNQYFFQVPDARSILHYFSDFDKQFQFLPEILKSYQKLLLNETYDSLLRMNNIRSLEMVDSVHIDKLIQMLGGKVASRDATLRQKHNLLDEVNNANRIAGTKDYYNYYNFSTDLGKILKIEQLYTPIQDNIYEGENVKRYVTFRTCFDLGAIEKREYRFPYIDYGYVDVLANPEDSIMNSTKEHPRELGILKNPARGSLHIKGLENYQYAIMKREWKVYINDENGNTTLQTLTLKPNTYIKNPQQGPNKPTLGYDYGSVEDEATSFYDYGNVEDVIKGRWITWIEWDRPKDWYPTNKVQIQLQIPPDVNREAFMTEFQNSFYELASAVLSIYGLIEVYNAGQNDTNGPWKEGDDIQFGLMTAPTYRTEEYTFMNDPERQISV